MSTALLALLTAPTFITLDFPGATRTAGFGTNGQGTIVGDFTSDKNGGEVPGWVLSQGAFTEIQFPGATFTRPIAVNDSGDAVGYYSDAKSSKLHGFLLSGGAFSPIDVPDADMTEALGIDAGGGVLGAYCDTGKSCDVIANGAGTFLKGDTHGFLLSGGVFQAIDVPGALRTEAWKRNGSGRILGRYAGPDGLFHLFLLGDGIFTSIDFPGAAETAPSWYSISGGLNDAGDIVAVYCSFAPCDFTGFGFAPGQVHGFILSGGVFTTVDFPGATTTGAYGLNANGDVVGVYLGPTGEHGFLRTGR